MTNTTGSVKRILRNLIDDLDSYVTIVVAIALVTLGASGVKLDKYLPSLTIALLALISLTLVRTRYRLQANKPVRVTPTDVLQWEDNVHEISRIINRSHEVWLWGAALTEHIPMLRATLEQGMTSRGLKARVLLIKPDSPSVKMLAFRAISPPSDPRDAAAVATYLSKIDALATRLNDKLKNNIEDLDLIAQSIPTGNLEYRSVDYLAPYVIYAFDPRSPNGRIVVRLGFHDGKNDERPTLWFDKTTDGKWFEHFMHQMQTAWAAASAMEEGGGWRANWPQGI